MPDSYKSKSFNTHQAKRDTFKGTNMQLKLRH